MTEKLDAPAHQRSTLHCIKDGFQAKRAGLRVLYHPLCSSDLPTFSNYIFYRTETTSSYENIQYQSGNLKFLLTFEWFVADFFETEIEKLPALAKNHR